MTPEEILHEGEGGAVSVGGVVPEDQEGLNRLIEALNLFREEHGLLSDDHPIL